MEHSRSLRTLLVVNSLLAGGLLWTIAVGEGQEIVVTRRVVMQAGNSIRWFRG